MEDKRGWKSRWHPRKRGEDTVSGDRGHTSQAPPRSQPPHPAPSPAGRASPPSRPAAGPQGSRGRASCALASWAGLWSAVRWMAFVGGSRGGLGSVGGGGGEVGCLEWDVVGGLGWGGVVVDVTSSWRRQSVDGAPLLSGDWERTGGWLRRAAYTANGRNI